MGSFTVHCELKLSKLHELTKWFKMNGPWDTLTQKLFIMVHVLHLPPGQISYHFDWYMFLTSFQKIPMSWSMRQSMSNQEWHSPHSSTDKKLNWWKKKNEEKLLISILTDVLFWPNCKSKIFPKFLFECDKLNCVSTYLRLSQLNK